MKLKHSGRRAAARRVFWFVAVVWLAASGCADERRDIGAAREAYASGKYEEALSLCERSIRQGKADGLVYYYSGMSLLALEKDAEAEDRFRAAIASDTTLVDDVAGALLERARASRDEGTMPRAALLARAAGEIDRDAVVGPLRFLVALSYFEERNWPEAAYWYSGAVAENPDTVAAESAYFNLAACRAAMGDSLLAIEALETELEKFPRGALSDRAAWTLSSLLFALAKTEFARGDYDAALRTAERIVDGSPDERLVREAMFLTGECFERMGEFDRAFEQYKAIATADRGAPGGISERARSKMKSFRDAGLR